MNIAFQLANACAFTIADMIADDDNLMQVTFVKKYPSVTIVVNMTLG